MEEQKINYFSDLKKEIDLGITQQQIPMGFKRLSNYVGLRKATYYLLGGYTGCLGYGTKVVMYDGSLKEVQNVEIGDKLIGPDSTPRTVLELKRGISQMYKIKQNKGQDYIVNEDHILHLRKRREKVNEYLAISVKDFLQKDKSFQKAWKGYKSEGVEFKEVPVEIDPYFLGLWLGDGTSAKPSVTTADREIVDYLKVFANENNLTLKKGDKYVYDFSATKKLVGFDLKENVEFQFKTVREASLKIGIREEYISRAAVRNKKYGNFIWNWSVKDNSLLLFLKNNNLKNNKHIPNHFLINSRENRLKLLAGIIDSDGHYQKGRNGFEITMKNGNLINQIAFLSRSLGFYTSINKKIATLKRVGKPDYVCPVFRLFIYGEKLGDIPTILPRKKAINIENKVINPLSTGISIEKLKIDEYYGFELDGDHLFLLEDFTVTHNSGKTSLADDAFVLNPSDWILKGAEGTNTKLKILYFSMERRRNYKMAKWIARKIFLEKGIILSVNRIMGWVDKSMKLNLDEHDLILEQEEYINWLLNDIVTIIDGPINPMGIKKLVDNYADKNGKREILDKHNSIYVPHKPEELVLIIYDHIKLQKKETRKDANGNIVHLSSKKEIIDQSSEDARKFRDFYGYSILKISQFNRQISNPIRIKNGDVEPQLEDFSESAQTQEDSDITLSLFDPFRYNVADPSGYDLAKLRDINNGSKKYRNLKILKNSYGSDDIRIGLAFQPTVGLFKEMPKLSETTDSVYDRIIDNSYFVN